MICFIFQVLITTLIAPPVSFSLPLDSLVFIVAMTSAATQCCRRFNSRFHRSLSSVFAFTSRTETVVRLSRTNNSNAHPLAHTGNARKSSSNLGQTTTSDELVLGRKAAMNPCELWRWESVRVRKSSMQGSVR